VTEQSRAVADGMFKPGQTCAEVDGATPPEDTSWGKVQSIYMIVLARRSPASGRLL
jgi:hypothetical protein